MTFSVEEYTFTVSEHMRAQDTWFLLLISAIEAQLRLVVIISLMRYLSISKFDFHTISIVHLL
jgi:hypothetical protein